MIFGELRLSQVKDMMEDNYDLFSKAINLCLAESIIEVDKANAELLSEVTHMTNQKLENIANHRYGHARGIAVDHRVKSQGGE